jgi:hypothetical protein
MTPPPATTAAGRRATTAAAKASKSRVAGEHKPGVPAVSSTAARASATRTRTPERTTRRTVNQGAAAPRSPRRVSGPARPAQQAVTPVAKSATRPAVKPATRAAVKPATRAAVKPATRTAAKPATRAAVKPATRAAVKPATRTAAKPAGDPRRGTATTPQRSVALRLPSLAILPHPRVRIDGIVDGFVRGRAWIPVLAVLLVGIVAMRVEVLKLGASVGRSMNVATELQGQNEIYRAQDSTLEAPARIERLATAMGLQEPGPTDNHFIGTHTSIAKVLSSIHAPDATSFQATLATDQAVDDAPATLTAAGGAAVSPVTAATDVAAQTDGTAATDAPAATSATDPPVTDAAATDAAAADAPATDAAATDEPATDAAATDTAGTAGSAGVATGGSGLAAAATSDSTGTPTA